MFEGVWVKKCHAAESYFLSLKASTFFSIHPKRTFSLFSGKKLDIDVFCATHPPTSFTFLRFIVCFYRDGMSKLYFPNGIVQLFIVRGHSNNILHFSDCRQHMWHYIFLMTVFKICRLWIVKRICENPDLVLKHDFILIKALKTES